MFYSRTCFAVEKKSLNKLWLCDATAQKVSSMTAQPNFDQLSFNAQATPSTLDPSPPDTQSGSLSDQSRFATLDNSSDEMMKLMFMWSIRQSASNLRDSESAHPVRKSGFDNLASDLPPPRRFHPSVWKAWTRRLEQKEKRKVREEICNAHCAKQY